jgi:dethiobiotin synthase
VTALAGLSPVIVVTGTDTGIGKTITTAALAAALSTAGADDRPARTVAVYKPVQTGVSATDDGDVQMVRQLTGIDSVSDGIRLPAPMAPVAAAELAGIALPGLNAHVTAIHELAARFDHVIVEGAGGLLVELDTDRHTLADLAVATVGLSAVIVVCRSGLGTLNHTALTLEALSRRHIATCGVVIGSWPCDPDVIDASNRDCLGRLGLQLFGAIPAGAGGWDQARFRDHAPRWFSAGSDTQSVTALDHGFHDPRSS